MAPHHLRECFLVDGASMIVEHLARPVFNWKSVSPGCVEATSAPGAWPKLVDSTGFEFLAEQLLCLSVITSLHNFGLFRMFCNVIPRFWLQRAIFLIPVSYSLVIGVPVQTNSTSVADHLGDSVA